MDKHREWLRNFAKDGTLSVAAGLGTGIAIWFIGRAAGLDAGSAGALGTITAGTITTFMYRSMYLGRDSKGQDKARQQDLN